MKTFNDYLEEVQDSVIEKYITELEDVLDEAESADELEDIFDISAPELRAKYGLDENNLDVQEQEEELLSYIKEKYHNENI